MLTPYIPRNQEIRIGKPEVTSRSGRVVGENRFMGQTQCLTIDGASIVYFIEKSQVSGIISKQPVIVGATVNPGDESKFGERIMVESQLSPQIRKDLEAHFKGADYSPPRYLYDQK